MRKNVINLRILVISLLISWSLLGVVYAEEMKVKTDPGVLPGSRTYFLKEWSRGFRQFFTFNPVKKAELELEIADEKSLELEKLKDKDPNNIEAIRKAVDNYNKNVTKLKLRLENLKDKSDNPNIDRLVLKLADKTINHQNIFEDLKTRFDDKDLRERLEKAEQGLGDAVAEVPKKVKNTEKIVEKFKEATEKREAIRGIQALKLIDRLEDKTVSGTDESFKMKLEELRGLIVKKFESSTPDAFKKIGTRIEDVDALINKARELISEIEKKIAGKMIERTAIEKMLQGAKDHLAKAVEARMYNKLGEAYGQATAAISQAKNSLRHLENPKETKEEVMEAKPRKEVKKESPLPRAEKKTNNNTNKVWKVGILAGNEFRPQELKIKKGEKVQWTNLDSVAHWPAGGPHPEHTGYPEKGGCIGSAFDACSPLNSGKSFEFVFNEIGTWTYHDHLNSDARGVIVVSD